MEEGMGIALPLYPGAKSSEYEPERIGPKVKCQECGACCIYVSVEIDSPTTVRGTSDIIWYLLHDSVRVSREAADEWYIEFRTRCKALAGTVGSSVSCTLYADRPSICREHSDNECEVNGTSEGKPPLVFYDAQSFIDWLAQKKPKLYAKMRKKRLTPAATAVR
jgi:Fe-S-cluster containining protein